MERASALDHFGDMQLAVIALLERLYPFVNVLAKSSKLFYVQQQLLADFFLCRFGQRRDFRYRFFQKFGHDRSIAYEGIVGRLIGKSGSRLNSTNIVRLEIRLGRAYCSSPGAWPGFVKAAGSVVV